MAVVGKSGYQKLRNGPPSSGDPRWSPVPVEDFIWLPVRVEVVW